MTNAENFKSNEPHFSSEFVGNYEVGNVNLELASILQNHGFKIDFKDAYSQDHKRLLHHTAIHIPNYEQKQMFNLIKSDTKFRLIEIASTGNHEDELLILNKLNTPSIDEITKSKLLSYYYDRAETNTQGWLTNSNRSIEIRRKVMEFRNKKEKALKLSDGSTLPFTTEEEMHFLLEEIVNKYLPPLDHLEN